MTKRSKWMMSVALVLSLGGLGGWAAFGSSGKADSLYTVEGSKKQDLRETVTANGEIQSRTKVQVGTTVTAEIKELHVKDGQEVKAGDLLVTLDQEHLRQEQARIELALGMAKEDLRNAQTTFDKQEASFHRQEALHRSGLVSTDAFQDAKLARDTSASGLERARLSVQQADTSLAQAKDALSKTVIRAPMAGRVTGLKAEKGEMAIAGQTNVAGAMLMVLSDMAELVAEIKVAELEVVKLRPGQAAEIQVDALPGQVLEGRVLDVATSAERSTSGGMNASSDAQNYKVRIQLTGSQAAFATLRPGMSARVAVLASESKGVLTVPLQALQERDDRGGKGLMSRSHFVAFVYEGGVVRERTLRIGTLTRKAAEVLEGLKEGDQVITGPVKALGTLQDGAKIKLDTGGKNK